MSRLVTYATDESNYEEFRQQVLNETGYLMYVGPDYRLYAVASDGSAAAIDAAMPGYTLYQAEEGSTLPSEVAAFTAELDGTGGAPVSGGTAQGGGQTTTEGEREEESRTEEGVGGLTGERVSILRGADMEWFFDPDSGKWYVRYGLPNSNMSAVYEATGSQLDAIFGDGQRPAHATDASFSDIVGADGVVFAGDISEVEGTGSYEDEVARVTALGLDEGRLPLWAQGDPQVMDIIYLAEAEQKSDEWVLSQLSKLDSFKARFPGIDQIMATGTVTLGEAVGGFLEFEEGVNAIRKRYDLAPASVERLGQLLNEGYSLTDVDFIHEAFDTMSKNAGAFAAFNEVLAARGLDPLGINGQLAFLAGTAPAELYDIWEEASFARAAEEAGLDIGVEGAMDLARRTDGHSSFGQALEGLSAAARNLLAFRADIELGRYDLDEQDLIDLSLGLAPSSGKTQAQVARNVQRALAASRAGVEGPRANMFRRFTDRGTPQAVSGGTTRAER